MTAKLGLALALIALAGCSHAKTTDQGKPAKGAEPEAETAKKREPARQRAPEPASKPEDVPVSTSPAGLLAPGADDKIRDKLAAAGFAAKGKSTDEALRRFQRANDLPATGIPDHETVKKLGLDPNDIFRAAAVKD
jgi:putative peptidoglycan binding protein